MAESKRRSSVDHSVSSPFPFASPNTSTSASSNPLLLHSPHSHSLLSSTNPPPLSTTLLSFASSSLPSATSTLNFSSTSTTSQLSAPSFGHSTASSNGVVVVGAVGNVEEDVAQLLNRILDAQIFRPNAGKAEDDVQKQNFTSSHTSRQGEVANFFDFECEDDALTLAADSTDTLHTRKTATTEETAEEYHKETLKQTRGKERLNWMKRRLQHYYDEERGVVYVMFSWDSFHLERLRDKELAPDGFSSLLEQDEADVLRGLLFMFLVCHVILFVKDGSSFEPKMLQMFRILQVAKHSLAPYVKLQALPGALSSSHTKTQPSRSIPPSTGTSPGRGAVGGRQGSMIALMSGTAPILVPGLCTPVLLFVCFEDFSDLNSDFVEVNSFPNNSSGNQSNLSTHGSKLTLPSKPSIQILMAKRSPNKMEGSQRKKLQVSLEAQIRFLIKRCRVIAGSADVGHLGSGVGSGVGPRTSGSAVGSVPGVSGGGALFTLDPTRAVIFLEKSINRSGEALDAATDVLEQIWRGEQSIDSLLELSGMASDDLQHLKEFLLKQSDVLRGKGGLSGTSTGGSVGVGMVAAAAAAAAASAASVTSGSSAGVGKPIGSHPELPSMMSWLSTCNAIVEALMTAEGKPVEERERVPSASTPSIRIMTKKAPLHATESSKPLDFSGLNQSRDALESALSFLQSSSDLNMKFSTYWCKKALPSALEVYLEGLPSCYPTALHVVHLQKALHAFQKMVRGPAVTPYSQKLKNDCEKVWKSGRQLCDAVSLTGKPCIYQVHETPNVDKNEPHTFTGQNGLAPHADDVEKHIVKPHSSRIVFLHACACGRSRQLREDPFEYEGANVNFYHFPHCENMLPSLVLPETLGQMPSKTPEWSLVRLGNSRYYQPSVGLLQDGFCTKRNFLSPWYISLRCREGKSFGDMGSSEKENECVGSVNSNRSIDPTLQNKQSHSPPKSHSNTGKPHVKEHVILPRRMTGTNPSQDPGSLVGKGSASVIKKASISGELLVNFGEDSAFPPLPQRHERQLTKVKNKKEVQSSGEAGVLNYQEGLKKSAKDVVTMENSANNGLENQTNLPLVTANEKPSVPTSKGLDVSNTSHRLSVYIGFEHECPYGHRYFLSFDQVTKLGGIYCQSPDTEEVKVQSFPNEGSMNQHVMDSLLFSDKLIWPRIAGEYPIVQSEKSRLSDVLQRFDISEGSGEGCHLLNSNLPIYLNCPYCKVSGSNMRRNNLTFAGTVSQLQRVFLVTPPFPVVLGSRPVVEFEASRFPQQIKSNLKFSIGCEVILPPESVLCLRLPFIYSSKDANSSLTALIPKADQPEHMAWLVKGTALYIASKRSKGLLDG